VLVVEDEQDIAELLMLHLADLGLDATWCRDGAQALQLLRSRDWDLLLLDLRLPGLDGLEITRRLRSQGNRVPILMLTAKTTELDRVLGLELGADDYVSKPFSVVEVMARVKALLRRASMDAAPERAASRIVRGALVVDEATRAVTLGAAHIELTAKEFDLLMFFAQFPGRVFRRAQLLDQVWGTGHDGYEHTVNSHINRLRAKLQAAGAAEEYILTVWGVGYKFNDALATADVA
jgi:DNA-binding response OmpR family regulator